MEFLHQRIYLPNKLATLLQDILAHGVVILECISKMFDLVDPGQGITTDHHLLEFSLSGSESQTLCFTFYWIWIGTKLQIMCFCIFFTCINHALQRME